MTRTKKHDNSLGFVDVITNGLGGMLVLFFLAVALQAVLEWHGNPGKRERPQSPDYPFVVVVKPVDGKVCFSEQNVWRFKGTRANLISPVRGESIDWGPDYALCFINNPLSQFSDRLSLVTNRSVELEVDVYPAGAKRMAYRVTSAQSNEPVRVWPKP